MTGKTQSIARKAKSQSPKPISRPAPSPSFLSGSLSGSTPKSISSSAQEKFKDASGYLGLTSFNATINENDQNEEVLEEGETALLDHMTSPDPTTLQILRAIPDESTCTLLMDCYNKYTNGIPIPGVVLEYTLDTFWSAFRPFLKHGRKESDLQRAAEIIIKNGQYPLHEADDS
jgi:hypothetical protein